MDKYAKRKVAARDAGGCLICDSRTVTVLHCAASGDWFFCCDLHLQDNPQFAQPNYTPAYHAACRRVADLASRLAASEKAAAAGWDSWLGRFAASKKKPAVPAKDGNVSPQGQDKTEDKEEKPAEVSAADLRREYERELATVATLRNKPATYTLSAVMLTSRLERRTRVAARAERAREEEQAYSNTDPQQLLQTYHFPELPKPKR
ncbi:FACL052Cp [Eremothecium gossypii FDAG1]|nr:FACL052Cp [Eremothecium gossypii FDAG1]